MLVALSSEIERASDVSVVIPVWGDYAGATLEEALASIRAQDMPAHVVVVDNASDPPLVPADGVEMVRSEERLTVGATRNLGLRSVTTPYVIFWDADDLMLPGTVRFLRERMAQTPEAVLVAGGIVEGDPPRPHRWPRPWTFQLTRFRRTFAFGHCVWSLFPTTGGALMRTAAARESGFGDANSGEDWVLGVSIVFRGRVLLETRPVRLYRRQVGSLWEAQRSVAQLVVHARAVRQRIRDDEAIPRWASAFLPAIAVLQVFAACIVHPMAMAVRWTRRRGSFKRLNA